MTALKPEALYLTHYGKVVDVPRIARDLLRLVDAHAEVGRRCATIDDPQTRVAALKAGVHGIAVDEAKRQNWGIPVDTIDDVLAMDIQLNADGSSRGSRAAARRRPNNVRRPDMNITSIRSNVVRIAVATAFATCASSALAADLTLLCAGAMKAPVSALLAKRSPSLPHVVATYATAGAIRETRRGRTARRRDRAERGRVPDDEAQRHRREDAQGARRHRDRRRGEGRREAAEHLDARGVEGHAAGRAQGRDRRSGEGHQRPAWSRACSRK